MAHFLRQHAELDFSQLTDSDIHTLVSDIKQASGTSQVVINSQPMQVSLAALLVKDGAFTLASTAVNGDKAKLKTDLATEVTARGTLIGEVRAYATLAENGSKSAEDLKGTGLPVRTPPPKKTLPPEVPAAIDVVFPKKGHGKATASVHETGKHKGKYVAQVSTDPFGPTTWAALGMGNGKARTVTGASGTKVWVRFASVRGQLQSDWCTPVLITLP